MAEQVQLLGVSGSPFCSRVEIALKLKGVRYEFIEEDLSDKSPLLLKYNPVHKKIPVLVLNGKPVAESLIILEYIDEIWKRNPILPQDPYCRATSRFWASFIDQKLLPATWNVHLSDEKERKAAIDEALQLLKVLENELRGKSFFGGDTIGYLDIAAVIVAFWFVVLQEASGVELLNEEKLPLLFKWIGKVLEVEVVKECLPPKDQLRAYYRGRVQALAASK